jgi:twitching motility protein PilT
VDRIIAVFPHEQQEQIRATLADSLQAVVSQTLFKRRDGKGRCAALEILIVTPAVRNLIRDNKTFQIPTVLQTGKKYGMQSLDDAIMDLLNKRRINPADAYLHCLDKERFRPFIGHASDEFE